MYALSFSYCLDKFTRPLLQTEEARNTEANKAVLELLRQVQDLHAQANGAAHDKDRYVIPPHLHDLQEADLPEQQRGLVISEIAMFRERAAKKEREKQREVLQQARSVTITPSRPPPTGPNFNERRASMAGTPTQPSGWAMRQQHQQQQQAAGQSPGPVGTPPSKQTSSQPAGFVRESEASRPAERTDEQMEQDRRDQRAKEENESFRDVSIKR